MALVVADRVKETTTTTGTGTYTLAGAVTGFESFASIGNGNTTYYCCTDGSDFEVGIGTYASSGTTLARTTILQSSNSDSAVNWTSGTRDIFVTQPAEKAVYKEASEYVDAFLLSNSYGSSSNPVEFSVTVVTKTSAHPYYGDGSSLGYAINGIESPALTLYGVDNVTSNSEYHYRFTLSSSDMSNHPFRLYLDADKTTAYTTGVTTTSTYLQIAVTEDTPSILYYQCSSHAYMGNHAVVSGSNKINHSEALISFPTATTTLIGTDTTDTLTNKTLTSPKINENVAVTATATEINILDGVTSTTAELNILDGVTSTTAELNILDGVTSTTAELNILDGVTSTTAELNILDGVTSTATELNVIDGDTSASAITLADADRLVTNDGGTMKQVALTTLKTYLTSAGFSSEDPTALAIALG